jgi:hypothetical protein
VSGRGNGGFAAFMAAVFLLLGIVVSYVNSNVYDSGNFANNSLQALDDGAVRGEISKEIANALVPPGSVAAGQADAAFSAASDRLFENAGFRTIVRTGVGALHDSVFDRDANAVGVQLAGVGEPVRAALQSSAPALAAQVPADASVTIFDGDPPAALLDVTQAGEKVRFVGIALLAAAALMALIALAIARFRSVALSTFGITLAVGAVLLVAGMLALKALLLGTINDNSGLEDALSGVWSAFFGSLQTELIVLAVAGVAIPIATRLIRTR